MNKSEEVSVTLFECKNQTALTFCENVETVKNQRGSGKHKYSVRLLRRIMQLVHFDLVLDKQYGRWVNTQ